MTMSVAGDSSDEELEWEEVHVPEQEHPLDEPLELELSPGPAPLQNIEITLQAHPKKDDTKKKAAAALHARRVLRTTSHKIHTVALLANALVRNRWINDPLLHARLISITPLALQNGFAMIHKSRIPDQNKRGRLFEAAVDRLVTWWCETYFSVTPTGHIKSRTFDEVEAELAQAGESDEPGTDEHGYERIRSVESLMKHLLMQRGSRDTSAQLFTALCRALDIPARLVVSLQSVPWKSSAGKQASMRNGSKGKGKAPQRSPDDHADLESDIQSETEDIVIPHSKYKGKGKAVVNPVIKLRQRKSQSATRNGSPAIGARVIKSQDPTTTPPVFWTEVFSRADSRWLPVDPIRGIVNKRHVFDPGRGQATGPSRSQENRMLYVIGLEEDGFGRDITPRYAREYTAKVSKAQAVGSGPAGGRKEWWANVVQSITRPYRLQRDDLEDDELHTHQLTEGMPTTIVGFKNHPLYALARHLRRDEVIDPPTELGKFRGEPVYPRSSVISLKTAENWMRQGRIIRQGCHPMKMVKQRAVTINRQREMELAVERAKAEGHAGGGDEEVMQGMYAFSQTELYRPEPIKDGKIPKNDFGNIDLYVPSMLPEGAVHIPFKGAAKIARKLGFDHAEAVTGFEFRKRRAVPVIQGVVVAAENENVIVEACLEAEQDAEERARAKRLERACKRWVRLVHGLRIRERLQQQYASAGEPSRAPPPLEGQGRQPEEGQSLERKESWLDVDENEQPGGYLTTADDVVEPFHLPRDLHRLDPTTTTILPTVRLGGESNVLASRDRLIVPPSDDDDDDTATKEELMEMEAEAEVEMDLELPAPPRKGVPKTMQELAESHAKRQREEEKEGEATPSLPPPPTPVQMVAEARPSRGRGRGRGATRSRTSRRRGETRMTGARTARTSEKRTRRRKKGEEATSDVDGEEEGEEGGEEADGGGEGKGCGEGEGEDDRGTPLKRRRLEASVPTHPDESAGSGLGRVLRPRRQKSAGQLREERDMEEAYRRAVAG